LCARHEITGGNKSPNFKGLAFCCVICPVLRWYPDGIRAFTQMADSEMICKRITSEAVEAMQPGCVLWDGEVRGFGVRCRKRDRVYLVKTRIGGVQKVLTIGRHGRGAWGAEKARREAQRLLGLIRDGQDPAAERDEAKAAPTMATLAERYTAEHSAIRKKLRTRAEDERLLRLHILPALGALKVQDIVRADAARLHAAIAKDAPIAANRAVALLSSMMNWAEKVGVRQDGTNPCRHVARSPEKHRERTLSPEELARLGEALNRAAAGWTEDDRAAWRLVCADQTEAAGVSDDDRAAWIAARQPERDSPEDWRAIAALRLLIFTGARLSEVLTLQWDWINQAAGVARLPDSKTGAKNLFLPAGALDVLAKLPRYAGRACVFPGDGKAPSFVGIQRPWRRVRALAGLPDLRIHDLRHVFASTAVSGGDSLFIVGKLLGHRQATTTERYSHLAPDPAREAANRTAERLGAMLDGRSAGRASLSKDRDRRGAGLLRSILAGQRVMTGKRKIEDG
jgi:integrase